MVFHIDGDQLHLFYSNTFHFIDCYVRNVCRILSFISFVKSKWYFDCWQQKKKKSNEITCLAKE